MNLVTLNIDREGAVLFVGIMPVSGRRCLAQTVQRRRFIGGATTVKSVWFGWERRPPGACYS